MKNLLFVFIFFPLMGIAQVEFGVTPIEEDPEITKTREEIISILTNDDHKEWHHKEIVMSNNSCKKGETFTFFKKDSTLSIKRCLKGDWDYQNAYWLLKYRTEYDWLILLNEEKYHLIFKNYNKHEELILRPTEISDKLDKVNEIILVHDPDIKKQTNKPKKKKAKANQSLQSY